MSDLAGETDRVGVLQCTGIHLAWIDVYLYLIWRGVRCPDRRVLELYCKSFLPFISL